MKKYWYAVYTKPHCEIKVAALLSKKKIENYCPLNLMVNQLGNKKRIIYEPLFQSFVFVHALDSEMQIIRQTSSVVNFVYWLGKPVVITDAEIENMQKFTKQYSNLKLEKTNVNSNGIVKIINDPNIDVNSNTISLKNKNLEILLPSLGYIIIATGVEKSNISIFNDELGKNKMVS